MSLFEKDLSKVEFNNTGEALQKLLAGEFLLKTEKLPFFPFSKKGVYYIIQILKITNHGGHEPMNRILSFALFILIAISIYFLMHYFVFRVLIQYLPFFAKYRKFVKLFFLVSGLTFPVTMFLSRSLKFHLLSYYAYIWLGVMAIAFFILFIDWILIKVFPGSSKILTTVALAVVGVISVLSLVNGIQTPRVKKITIPIKNLPQDLDGFSMVQLSDLHLDPLKPKRIIASIFESINSLDPDLIAITGDLIEGDEIWADSYLVNYLKNLRAAYGIVAITGNHEFYAGIENFTKLAQKADIKILRNQCIKVADSIQLIGLDDDTARSFSMERPSLDSLIKECNPEKPIILLYHRPTGFDRAAAQGVDLQLSGHTHAGQIPPMDIMVYLYYKYPSGLYKKNGSYIYTTSGAGYWGPPMRFLNRSEIVHIILKSKPKDHID